MSNTNYPSEPFGILELGHKYLTEVATETQQIMKFDPLKIALPQKNVPVKEVRVQWREDELRIMGIVVPGERNKMNTFGNAKEFSFKPAHFRRGDFLDMEMINHLLGLDAEKEMGMDLVQERINNLAEQAELVMTVLRAQLMSGGINLTDYETGNSVVANSGIPSDNLYTVGAGILAGQAVWSDKTNGKPVDDFQKLLYIMELKGKNKPTHAVVSGALLQLFGQNVQVRNFLPGSDTGLYNLGLVTWNKDGTVDSIAGVKLVPHKMIFDAQKSDLSLDREYIWPINKVAFFSIDNPQAPSQKLGYSVVTRGEHPTGGTGMWIRSGEVRADNLIDPTLPPGVPLQAGMSGLPVLYKPWWVHIVTACSVANLTAELGDQYVPA